MNARQKRKYIRNFILGARKEIEAFLVRILMGEADILPMHRFAKRIYGAGLIEFRPGVAVTQKGLDLISRKLYP